MTKAGPDEIVVTETDFEAGRRGPPPHVHKLHADSFEYLVADRRHDESETEFLARFDTYYVDRPHPADT